MEEQPRQCPDLRPLAEAVEALCAGGPDAPLQPAAVAAVLSAVGALASARPQLTQEASQDLWVSCCTLWNLCVEIANAPAPQQPAAADGVKAPTTEGVVETEAQPALQPPGPRADRATVAQLRQCVCEALVAIRDEHLAEEEHVARLGFAMKAAQEWVALSRDEPAQAVIELATSWAAVFEEVAREPDTGPAKRADYCRMVFDAAMARLLVAWRLGAEDLAASLVARCRAVIEGTADAAAPPLARSLRLRLATQLQQHAARAVLPARPSEGGVTAVADPSNPAVDPAATKATAVAKGEAAAPSVDTLRTALAELTLAHELLGRVAAQPMVEGGAAATWDGEAEEARRLEGQTLLALAIAHDQLGDATATLACVRALRQLPAAAPNRPSAGGPSVSAPPPAAAQHPAVALLAFSALVATGDAAAAQGEALGIAASDASDRDACLGVSLELLRVPAAALGPDALRPVMDLVLGRFPGDCQLLADIAEAALDATACGNSGAEAEAGCNGAGVTPPAARLMGREALLLELLERHPTFAEAAAAAAAQDGANSGANGGSGGEGQGAAEGPAAVHAALCSRAAVAFQARRFAAAERLYSAALPFTMGKDRGVLCRCLALCHMGLGAVPRAAEFAALAERYHPKQVATTFLRFKLDLDSADDDAAAREVGALTTCQGFEPAVLQMACQEALAAGRSQVARQALTRLHALLVSRTDARTAAAAAAGSTAAATADDPAPGGSHGATKADSTIGTAADAATGAGQTNRVADKTAGAAAAGGTEGGKGKEEEEELPEATVLRCLVKLGLEEVAAAVAAAAGAAAAGAAAAGAAAAGAAAAGAAGGAAAGGESGGQKAAALPTALDRLGRWLHVAVQRLGKLGPGAFVGPGEAHAGEHVAWFAAAAWNAGLDAAEAREYPSCAVLMNATAELLGLHPDPGPRHLRQQQMAYLVAGSAALEVVKVSSGSKQAKSSLTLASRMVAASRGVAGKLSEAEEATGSSATGTGGGSGALASVFAALQDFGIAARRGAADEMGSALQRAVALPAVTADHLLRMAAVAGDPEFGNPAVLFQVLQASLRRLMAAATPDAPKVALVVRQMVGAAGDDGARLAVLQEGEGIVGAMVPQEGGAGCYPEREARWLAATAWNAGLSKLRAGDKRGAAPFLRVGLDLARRVPRWGGADLGAMEGVAAETEAAAALAAQRQHGPATVAV